MLCVNLNYQNLTRPQGKLSTYSKYPGIWYFLLMTLTNVGLFGNYLIKKKTLHKHAPLRQKRVRSNPVLWITPIIKQTMRNRNFYKKRAFKCNSRYHWQEYKNLRNRLNRERKLSKSQFYHNEIENCAISGNV